MRLAVPGRASRVVRRHATQARQWRGYASLLQQVSALPAPFGDAALQQFRDAAFAVEQPLLLEGAGSSDPSPLPAMRRWFGPQRPSASAVSRELALASYLEPFAMAHVSYELIYPQTPGGPSAPDEAVSQFCAWLSASDNPLHHALGSLVRSNIPPDAARLRLIRLDAPLALFIAALRYNQARPGALTQLYIAQSAINGLPAELQADLPTPRLVREAGRGDVYDSSIWLGLEPTYTPWHRDPNPNLFCQLCSAKAVRLSPPSVGDAIYRDVQVQLGRHGSSRIRGEEMMQGPEREALHDAVWGAEPHAEIREVRVHPGDALFIPKGWWHSLKSASSDGRLNGSVNWWFR